LNLDIDLGFRPASPETTFWTDLFKLAENVYNGKENGILFFCFILKVTMTEDISV
jgi:hypothetical protein